MQSLTPKQTRFCEEYIIDLNATQAAIRAGYSKKTAAEQAVRLLGNVKVSAYVKKLQDKRSGKTEITADWVLKNLREIVVEARGIREYNPANKALELIGKHIGMFTEKIDMKQRIDISMIPDDELDRLIETAYGHK